MLGKKTISRSVQENGSTFSFPSGGQAILVLETVPVWSVWERNNKSMLNLEKEQKIFHSVTQNYLSFYFYLEKLKFNHMAKSSFAED